VETHFTAPSHTLVTLRRDGSSVEWSPVDVTLSGPLAN
jgi:hypothetical protein